MTNLIKRKWLLSLIAIAVMVATVCLISCGGSDSTLPSVTNPTGTEVNPTNGGNGGGGQSSDSSTLDISEWLNKQSWTKYETTIELNGKKETYSIVFPWEGQVGIYDNYNGNQELDYTWGYSSGHKIAFFLTSSYVRFWNKDTIIINMYHMMSRLEKYGKDANGSIKEKEFMNRSHFYDRQPEKYPNKREEDFYNVALPKYLKLTSEGLLMTYYTYNSKTGAIVDNQTALFKIN